MLNTKRCEFCQNPFSPENNENQCPDCRGLAGVEHFFGADREMLTKSIKKYPDLPIENSVEWRQRDLPERRYFLYPIIPEASITLVAGEDGSGKTMFCMGVTDAISKGENFCMWENRVGSPIKCLYFEGEMHPYDFRDRLNQMDTNANFNVFSVGGNYIEENSFSSGNLTEEEYRNAMAIEIYKREIKFVVIDNLASLAPGINENVKAEYDPINQWLLSLRHAGVTVFLVHHLGKGGEQRGTSAREDNVDNIIYIKKPNSHGANDGCKFNLSFDKFRGRVGRNSQDLVRNRTFLYTENPDGQYEWNYTGATLQENAGVLNDLADESRFSLEQIGQRNGGVSQSTITRLKKEFIEKGFLTEEGRNRTLTESGQQFLAQFG